MMSDAMCQELLRESLPPDQLMTGYLADGLVVVAAILIPNHIFPQVNKRIAIPIRLHTIELGNEDMLLQASMPLRPQPAPSSSVHLFQNRIRISI